MDANANGTFTENHKFFSGNIARPPAYFPYQKVPNRSKGVWRKLRHKHPPGNEIFNMHIGNPRSCRPCHEFANETGCQCSPRSSSKKGLQVDFFNVSYPDFREYVKCALTEPVSCFTVRSEHQYTGRDHQRASVRKHLWLTAAKASRREVVTWKDVGDLLSRWENHFRRGFKKVVYEWVRRPCVLMANGETCSPYMAFGREKATDIAEKIAVAVLDKAYNNITPLETRALFEDPVPADYAPYPYINNTSRPLPTGGFLDAFQRYLKTIFLNQDETWSLFPNVVIDGDTIKMKSNFNGEPKEGNIYLETDGSEQHFPNLGNNPFIVLRDNLVDYWSEVISRALMSSLICHPVNEARIDFNEYLGFVDLRPASQENPIALSFVKPPKQLRNDDYYVIQGRYAYAYGGIANFSSTFYLMHNHEGGATCGQAATIIAAGLLSDRGGVTLGPYDISHRVSKSDEVNESDDKVHVVHNKALSMRQMRHVLAKEHSGVNSFTVRMPAETPPGLSESGYMLECTAVMDRLTEAYLHARCPGLLFINDDVLYTPLEMRKDRLQSLENRRVVHTVVVTGYSTSPPQLSHPEEHAIVDSFSQGNLKKIIVHDTGSAPYLNVPAPKLWYSAAKSEAHRTDSEISGSFNMIFATPLEVKTSLWGFIHHIHKTDSIGEESDEHYGYGFNHYLKGISTNRTDFRAFLLRRHSVDHVFPAYYGVDASDMPDLFWCVIGYVKTNGTTKAEKMWIMDAEVDGCAGTDMEDFEIDYEYLVSTDRDVLEHFDDVQSVIGLSKECYPESVTKASPPAPTCHAKALLRGLNCRPTLLTSSSPWSIDRIVRYSQNLLKMSAIDLFMFRGRDLLKAQEYTGRVYGTSLVAFRRENQPDMPPRFHNGVTLEKLIRNGTISTLEVLACRSNNLYLAEWLAKEALLPGDGNIPIKISSFATYFPRISDIYDFDDVDYTPQGLSTRALTNCVAIAARLADEGLLENDIIVEMVCGSICTRLPSGSLAKTRQEEKIIVDGLIPAFHRIVHEVNTLNLNRNHPWTLALEIEPGVSYFLNKREMAERLCDKLDEEGLSEHISINLDIAHLGIIVGQDTELQAEAIEFIENHLQWISNAHICDHPYNHYRDQPYARCRNSYSFDRKMLELYEQAGEVRNELNRPYSGNVAIELEGNARYEWIKKTYEFLVNDF